MILSMLANKEIGLWLDHNSFDSVQCILPIFSMDGNTPDEKDRLTISGR